MNARQLGLIMAAHCVVAGTANAQATRSCVEVDRRQAATHWPSAETSPPRSDLDALERRLKTAPPGSMPAVLLQLGRLKTRFVVDSAYAAARPNEYQFNEFAGAWLYTGWHFAELQKRYPSSHFVDDAAYEQTFVPMGGECEGYLPCQVSWLWMKMRPFLVRFPQSPLADSAVQRTLLAFSAIKPGTNLVRNSPEVDVWEIRGLVDSLEVTANALAVPRRVTLLTRVAELREQMGNLPAARSTYRIAADLRGGPVSDCAQRHVRRLEARLARP